MTYAVIHSDTKKIARDEQNYQHIYSTREQANKIAANLNNKLFNNATALAVLFGDEPVFVVRAI